MQCPCLSFLLSSLSSPLSCALSFIARTLPPLRSSLALSLSISLSLSLSLSLSVIARRTSNVKTEGPGCPMHSRASRRAECQVSLALSLSSRSSVRSPLWVSRGAHPAGPTATVGSGPHGRGTCGTEGYVRGWGGGYACFGDSERERKGRGTDGLSSETHTPTLTAGSYQTEGTHTHTHTGEFCIAC